MPLNLLVYFSLAELLTDFVPLLRPSHCGIMAGDVLALWSPVQNRLLDEGSSGPVHPTEHSQNSTVFPMGALVSTGTIGGGALQPDGTGIRKAEAFSWSAGQEKEESYHFRAVFLNVDPGAPLGSPGRF
ncbi:hypothetical protein M513_06260 [Trichuris suis]|uniref:Uncharacterized protein n=1 Tax=Trichuris suis TaxID=68888 RepID=A0A085M6V4_9BILA|nr:hypothetical protein M513_06260 [Trichuris suis]